MPKRLTDTKIWEEDWFIDLPNKYKLMWNYIKDKCDNVGIWRPNKSILQKIIGEPLVIDDFLQFVNVGKERITVLPSGRWWIKDYFIFQYGDKFSPTSPVHKGALKTLLQNGIHINQIFKEGIGNLQNIDFESLKEIAYSKDFYSVSIAFGNHTERVKDKNKDKVKDKEYSIIHEPEIKNNPPDHTPLPVTVESEGSTVVVSMVNIFKKSNKSIQIIPSVHYPPCLQIAYKIADLKKWPRKDVSGPKMNDLLVCWQSIVDFIKTDSWLSTRSLMDLSTDKEWDRVVLKMSNDKSFSKKTVPTTHIKKEVDTDFDKYSRKK